MARSLFTCSLALIKDSESAKKKGGKKNIVFVIWLSLVKFTDFRLEEGKETDDFPQGDSRLYEVATGTI